jgi:hypothetical protein
MKGVLALAGVGIFGAVVYFLAKGKAVPNTSSKQGSGSLGKPQNPATIAASLLTSQNVASLGGLLSKVGGGPATVAPQAGTGGSGFVTSLDDSNTARDNSGFVTSLDS